MAQTRQLPAQQQDTSCDEPSLMSQLPAWLPWLPWGAYGNAAAQEQLCAAGDQQDAQDGPVGAFAPLGGAPFELPPLAPLAPLPAAGPAAGAAAEAGVGLSEVLAAGGAWLARRVIPIIGGMWPKDTAPPELDRGPADYPVPEVAPDGPLGELPKLSPTGPDKDPCEPEIRCPHRGGDPVHNACADWLSDPELAGCDVFLNGKNFDGASWATKTVFEAKTTATSTYNRFVREMELNKQLASATKDAQAAAECGWNYALAVSDLDNYTSLADHPALSSLVNLMYTPECAANAP